MLEGSKLDDPFNGPFLKKEWLQSTKVRAKFFGQNNQNLKNCNIFCQNNYEFAHFFLGCFVPIRTFKFVLSPRLEKFFGGNNLSEQQQ